MEHCHSHIVYSLPSFPRDPSSAVLPTRLHTSTRSTLHGTPTRKNHTHRLVPYYRETRETRNRRETMGFMDSIGKAADPYMMNGEFCVDMKGAQVIASDVLRKAKTVYFKKHFKDLVKKVEIQVGQIAGEFYTQVLSPTMRNKEGVLNPTLDIGGRSNSIVQFRPVDEVGAHTGHRRAVQPCSFARWTK